METRARVLTQARLAQSLTLAWMVVEGGLAIGAGVAARSVALTAFGADSLVELASSAVVLVALYRGTGDADRRAARFVGVGLWVLVAYVVVTAIASLVLRVRPDPSPLGVGVTATALVVMAVLWRWRLRLAHELGSAALRGDAACSAVCLYLSATTLAGLLLNAALGWWWADPLAALALTWWIAGEAREALAAD
ncbi:MAG: cation transporter [Chloroflexota bacterium]